MSRRRSGSTDFDDWDLLDDFPEKEPEKKPVIPRSDFDEDWAEYTREERIAGHKKPRRKNAKHRSGSGSGNGGKKLLLGIVALAAMVALIVGIKFLAAEGSLPIWDGESDRAAGNAERDEGRPSRNTTPTSQTDAPDVESTEPTNIQETDPPAVPKEYRYNGSLLSDGEKEAYDILVQGMLAQEQEIANIYLPDLASVDRVMDAIFYDYAEIFWYTGAYSTTYYEEEGYLDLAIAPGYDCTPEERVRRQNTIDSRIQGLLNTLYGESEYEKVKGVYEFLIDNTAYDYAYSDQSVYQILAEGRAVCAGYARAMQYILGKLDVEAIYISGEAGSPGDTESHAWNIVKIDGDYYQIDATWGDPYYEDGTQTKNFNYFCLTDDEMGLDHWADRQGYPPCTSTKHNYYRYEGRFLESYDTELIKVWMQEAEMRGEPLNFRVANAQLYQQVQTNLIEDGGIYDLMEEVLGEATGFSWSTKDGLYVLTISW